MGVSGSAPGPASPAACHLVEADVPDPDGPGGGVRTWRLVLDLGSGAFGPLQALAPVETIDAVALSHLHADHCLDVTALHVAAAYGPTRDAVARRGLPVWGPVGVAERLARAWDADPASPEGMTGPLTFHEWVPRESVLVGPFAITPVPAHHPVTAFGLQVTGPSEAGGLRAGAAGAGATAVLAYTGDTDADTDDEPGTGFRLDELAAGADLLLTEATFPSVGAGGPDLRGVHLSGRRAGAAARAAGVPRVLLTHVPPWEDPAAVLAEARSAFGDPARVELAVPGRVVRL